MLATQRRYGCAGVVVVAFIVVAEFFSGHIAGVQCRKAIQPQPDIGELIREHNIEAHDPFIHNTNGPPCELDIQLDMHRSNNSHQPLYLVPGTTLYWLPNADGRVHIPRGSTIELHCTKGFHNITGGTADFGTGNALYVTKQQRNLLLVCVGGTTFQLRGKLYEFRQFGCREPVKYNVERTDEVCGNPPPKNVNPGPADNGGGGSLVYRIGFNITSTRFVETMRMCHDMDVLRTHYTEHVLVPGNQHFEKSVKRLNFSTAGFFRGHNMNRLYSQKHQNEVLAALFGVRPEEYLAAGVTGKTFLARGHLAAKSDMIYASQQRSTFTYLNAAPQWQSFNAGQWAALEDAVRKFVATRGLEVRCYTGTYGTMELVSKDGAPKPLHLANDENGNAVLAVPKLFYRVLVNRRKPDTGIVLVGVNNPQASWSLIQEQYVVCSDVQQQVPWLSWIRNSEANLKKGYLYACHVDEFARYVQHLPSYLRNVTKLLIQ